MGQKWDSRYLSKKSDTLKCMLMQHKEFKGIFLPRGRQIRLHSWNRYIFGALSDVIKCVWNSNFRTSHRKWKKLFSRRKKKAESLVRLKVDLLKKGPRLRYDKEGYLLFFNYQISSISIYIWEKCAVSQSQVSGTYDVTNYYGYYVHDFSLSQLHFFSWLQRD